MRRLVDMGVDMCGAPQGLGHPQMAPVTDLWAEFQKNGSSYVPKGFLPQCERVLIVAATWPGVGHRAMCGISRMSKEDRA